MSAAGEHSANPLAAPYYADQALHGLRAVVENVRIARDTYRIRLAWPDLAQRIVPGQFVMHRLVDSNDPILGRPLALYDTWDDDDGQLAGVDIVYLVLGKMTGRLAQLRPGDELELWGPLGNGFTPTPTERLVMVAGGIGQTPFMALGREALGGRTYGMPPRPNGYADQATLCYGVRTAELLAGAEDFRQAGIEVRLASDDGSVGRHGLVTGVLDELLDEVAGSGASVRIACCGPEPMMEAVAHIAGLRKLPCEVSLETPMACGIGICFSCVAKVRQPDGEWDYKRTCVEGPIFDSRKIVW